MKTIYYVYQLNEKRNKYGNPYPGMTKDLNKRAKQWQYHLKLDYIPELIVLHTDTNELRTWKWEQDKREEWGWKRETSLRQQKNFRKKGNEATRKSEKVKEHCRKIATLGGKAAGKIAVESGHFASLKTTEHQKKAALVSAKKTAKLTKEQVEQIKKEYVRWSKEYSTLALAKKYNVTAPTIRKVLNGNYNIYKD